MIASCRSVSLAWTTAVKRRGGTMRSVGKALIAASLALLAAACGTSGSNSTAAPTGRVSTPTGASPSSPGYHPVIDPANFTAVVDNRWFPLTPGSTRVYAGTKDGEPSRDVYVVTDQTKLIEGVPC